MSTPPPDLAQLRRQSWLAQAVRAAGGQVAQDPYFDELLWVHVPLHALVGVIDRAIAQGRATIEPPSTTGAIPMQLSQDDIARVAHEVNRAYCQALGDHSQPTWEDAPEWQRASARMGVDLHTMGEHGPEASHRSWMQQKIDEGWKYGPVKDPEARLHPCMVPFDQLPREQQAKDFIFRGVVHALRNPAGAEALASMRRYSDERTQIHGDGNE